MVGLGLIFEIFNEIDVINEYIFLNLDFEVIRSYWIFYLINNLLNILLYIINIKENVILCLFFEGMIKRE